MDSLSVGEKMDSSSLHAYLQQAPLGKTSALEQVYDPSLLYPVSREATRREIDISDPLMFYGYDIWNAYELSWLNTQGKPVVAMARFDISCLSAYLIESKSFKLYLNSFNQTKFVDIQAVHGRLTEDIQNQVKGGVQVYIFNLEDQSYSGIQTSELGTCLDDIDVACDTYSICPGYLSSDPKVVVEKTSLYSHLFKSNCLVTGQPDWGSLHITYSGPQIDRSGLLKYIISFRQHQGFHEQCVERIFMDIMDRCTPDTLTVHARYTRRGGLDINPIRSSEPIPVIQHSRTSRQ